MIALGARLYNFIMSSHMAGAHYGKGRKMFCWASFRAPSTGAGPCENCEQCTVGNKADTNTRMSYKGLFSFGFVLLRPFKGIDAKTCTSQPKHEGPKPPHN